MKLLPQQEIMHDHLRKNDVAALWVDMGLGKTASVLTALDFYISDGDSKGALIIAPLRVSLLTWPNEIEKWYPWMKFVHLRTKEGQEAWRKGEANIYLLNYDMLGTTGITELFDSTKALDWPVDTVVWDEISKAKSHKSKRIKSFFPYRKFFKRHWGLTGTPIANSYLDLFNPFRLLDGGVRLGTSFHKYAGSFFDSDYMGWSYKIKGDWAKKKIEESIEDITLTLKAAEYMDIPPTEYIDHDVALHFTDYRRYKELEKQFLLKIKDEHIVGTNAAVLVGKLLQFTSGAIYNEEKRVVYVHDEKLDALLELIKKFKKENRNVLVLTSYIHEMDRILSNCEDARFFYNGAETDWNAGKIKVLVADPRSIGHGLNLQDGGSDIIWFTPTYSRELYDQANARLIRTGQTKPTTVTRLLVKDTIDWAVVEALRAKGDEQQGLKSAIVNLQQLRK